MNRGFSASSPSASRSFFTAVLMRRLKSPKVSGGAELLLHLLPRHHFARALDERGQNLEGLCWSLILSPLRRNSPHRRSV